MLAFFDAHQPYYRGQDFFEHGLWILHRLAIIDRHRHVVTRGASVMPINVTTTGIPREWEYEFTAKRLSSDEFGAILDIGPDVPDPNVESRGTLHIVVQEPGPDGLDNPNPVPLIKLLYDAYDEVVGVIVDARARFF